MNQLYHMLCMYDPIFSCSQAVLPLLAVLAGAGGECDLLSLLAAAGPGGGGAAGEAELARFLETRAGDLVQEFMLERQLGRRLEDTWGEDGDQRLTGVEQAIVLSVVDSFKNVVQTIDHNDYSPETVRGIFKGILDGVQELLPGPATPAPTTTRPPVGGDGLSYFAEWPNVCALLWYPYHQEKCGEARCLACAPAMMASARACRQTEGRVTRACIQRTLQGGYCDFCINKYVRGH